jgi:hypothetical protein
LAVVAKTSSRESRLNQRDADAELPEFQRFLEWIPWKYADNLISELLLFFVLNVLGYAFVIFLLLRIFFPDRSGELPPLTGKK